MALDIIAKHRIIGDERTKAYVERRTAEGLSYREIKRCLKRFLARSIFRQLEALGLDLIHKRVVDTESHLFVGTGSQHTNNPAGAVPGRQNSSTRYRYLAPKVLDILVILAVKHRYHPAPCSVLHFGRTLREEPGRP